MLSIFWRPTALIRKLLSWLFCAASMVLWCHAPSTLAQTTPTVITEPQSQTAIAGSNVTFWVTVGDGSAPAPLPPVSSGTLQLWLKADAGLVTNSSGQVSQWQDQSGHTNHAAQSATNNQPLLVFPAGLGGAAALRFAGTPDAASGDYLVGTGNVGVSNAMTAFAVYNSFFNVPDWGLAVWFNGQPAGDQTSEGFAVLYGEMDFTSWPDNFSSPFAIPTNTYRICTDRVNTNLSAVEMFDTTASSETNFSVGLSGLQTPAAGYYVGGLNPALTGDGNGRCFDGDIAEVIIYKGYLSDADRLTVQGYLQQKYQFVGLQPFGKLSVATQQQRYFRGDQRHVDTR